MTAILSLIANPNSPMNIKDVREHLGVVDYLEQDHQTLSQNIAIDIPIADDGAHAHPQILTEARNALVSQNIDVNIVNTNTRKKSLLIADMDSTMIEQECIDELARHAGLFDKISAITERAMRGELDFDAALIERVAMLEGLSTSVLEETYTQNISFTSGAKTLIATMKANGAYTALVSGGFTFFTNRVRDALGFDHDRANTLEIIDQTLSGHVGEPILGRMAKAQALEELCHQQSLELSQTIAVGDGANDLSMLALAGMGVAFHAKPATAQAASYCLHHADLTGLLYLQGIAAEDHVQV